MHHNILRSTAGRALLAFCLWIAAAGTCFAGSFEQLSFFGDFNGLTGTNSMAISADGQVVCFDDAQVGVTGLHCRDRFTDTTEIISRNLDGTVAAYSTSPAISRDGRYVFYWGKSNQITAGSTTMFDLYRYDRTSGTTELVAAGEGGDHWYYPPSPVSISADGRYLVYGPPNYVGINYPGQQFRGQIFDLQTGAKLDVRAMLPEEIKSSYSSVPPVLSGDGRTLVFVGSNDYGINDAYRLDLQTGELINLTALGDLRAQYDCNFMPTAVSDDGQRVLLSNWCSPGWPQLYDASDGSFTNLCTTTDGRPAAVGCEYSETQMSANGRVVFFRTYDTSLYPGNSSNTLGRLIRFVDENLIDWSAIDSQGKAVDTPYAKLSPNGDFIGFITAEMLVETDTPPHRGIDKDHYIYERSSIALKQATYDTKKRTLVVKVTSRLGAAAGLTLEGFGPMIFKSGTWSWSGVADNPGNVTVRGVEGSNSFAVTL